MTLPLTRNELRKAVTSHPKWDETRKAQNLQSDKLTLSELRALALTFDIKPEDVQREPDGAPELDIPELGAARPLRSLPSLDDIELPAKPAKPAKPANGHELDAMQLVMEGLQKLTTQNAKPIDRDEVRSIIKEEMGFLPSFKVELKRQDGSTYQSEGHVHPMFPKLLTILAARDARGLPVNVWISGPAGSGKTHAAEEAAKALGVDFYLQGALSMPHELVGFVDAGGTYHTTPFVRAFTNGGVILLDELDAGDNAALLALNSALANGAMSLPNAEMVKRHKDTIVIGAANTFGLGATADYIGRSKLDAAFLSRFPVKLAWDYDPALEQAICGNAKWAVKVQAARARARDKGLKVIIDPRHSIAGAALIAQGLSMSEAAEFTYLANLTAEQRKMVEGA